MPKSKASDSIHTFKSAGAWEDWLERNHEASAGVFLQLFKKDSGKQTFTYNEALDVALCFGWIDGIKKSLNAESWIQKFTPRRPKSVWSKRNRDHIERLTKQKRMRPAGVAQVEAAKADGRWAQAYDSPSAMEIPEDFKKLLVKNSKACAFFKTLNKANLYAIAWRLQTAKKPETRDRRMHAILKMLEEGKPLH